MAIGFIDFGIFVYLLTKESSNSEFSWSKLRNEYYICRARASQRRQLLSLSDCQLKDMGISRADANAEAQKPFWVE